MTIREKVITAILDLAKDAAVEDAMARLLLLAKIERGIAQADAGKSLEHGEVKERLAKCQK